MLSSIARLKTLNFLTKTILNTECIPILYFKSDFSTCKVFSNNKVDAVQHSNVHDFVSGNNRENFGKIVDLNPKEVEFVSEERSGRKKEKKKKFTAKIIEEENPYITENEFSQEEEKQTDKKIKGKKNLNFESLGFVMVNLKNKKQRQKEKKIYLEGKRLINDAINSGHQPLALYYSKKSLIENFNLSPNVQCVWTPYKTIQLWSDVNNCQGVIGVFKMPEIEKEKIDNCLPLTVICDNIREPGNMGCIIRLLSAVGCKKLLMTKGCVDVWEPKVIRAAAGAHFKSTIIQSLEWAEIEEKISDTGKVFLADSNCPIQNETEETDKDLFKTQTLEAKDLPLKSYDSVNYVSEDTVLVIGGETEGLSSSAYQFAKYRQGVKVFIPMTNGIESLNNSVALGVLSYEIRRQMQQKESPVESCDKPTSEGFSSEPITPV